jgi:peptide/nickel transport system substrate-binding protein
MLVRMLLGLTLLAVATPADAATLRVAIGGDLETLDPAQSSSYNSRIVFASLCDKLIELDPELRYVPQLATEWAWSESDRVLTLRLRPGVLFHDGERLDADAVRFNIERSKSAPYSRRQSELKPVERVEVIDPLTLRLVLAEPYAPLLAQLADRSGMMVSPKAAAMLGDKLTRQPVCTGPFKFAEWVAQDRIVFDRFERYWNADAIHFDRVVYQPIPDDAVRLANLKSGGLDLVDRVPPTHLGDIRNDRRLRLYGSASVGYRTLAINVNHGPRAKSPLGPNAKLREAFEAAIDREAINQVVFDGEFIPSNQPEAPGTPYHAKEFPLPKRDLARARALVAEAGGGRIPVSFLVGVDPVDQRVAQVIQAMTAEAGFDVTLEAAEAAALLAKIQSGDFEVALLIWSGRPDPDANISIWVACDGFVNWSRYCDPRVDAALRLARTTTVIEERRQRYADAAAIYLAARPYLVLFHLKWFWGASERLQGFVPHPDGIIRVQNLSLRN